MSSIKVLLKTTLWDAQLEIKESFQTVKKRLFDGQPFFELTLVGGDKKIYNKLIVGEITRTETVGKPKKKGK